MVIHLDPIAFDGARFSLKRIGDEDYEVLADGLATGRIMRRDLAGGRAVWFWTLTGPYIPQTLATTSGDAASLDEAKAAIKSAFDMWLRWAMGQGQVVWHTEYTPPSSLH